MRVRLLGPVELRREDWTRVEVAGPKRRAVLALLCLEFGRSVPLERLFELLWGDYPPAQAKAARQGHVAALRKALDGSSFVLLTRAPGYELTGDPEAVDALRFDALAARAAGLDDAGASAVLEKALSLWSGAALADCPTPSCAARSPTGSTTRVPASCATGPNAFCGWATARSRSRRWSRAYGPTACGSR